MKRVWAVSMQHTIHILMTRSACPKMKPNWLKCSKMYRDVHRSQLHSWMLMVDINIKLKFKHQPNEISPKPYDEGERRKRERKAEGKSETAVNLRMENLYDILMDSWMSRKSHLLNLIMPLDAIQHVNAHRMCRSNPTNLINKRIFYVYLHFLSNFLYFTLLFWTAVMRICDIVAFSVHIFMWGTIFAFVYVALIGVNYIRFHTRREFLNISFIFPFFPVE